MAHILRNEHGQAVVKNACEGKNVRFEEFMELVDAQMDDTGKWLNRRSLFEKFDDILDRIPKEEEQ